MGNIVVRDIREEDIPSVVDIQISGWQTAYKGIVDEKTLNSLDRNERINRRKNDYKDTGFIVAEIDGVIAGFCRFIDNNTFTPNISQIDCELLAIYVKPDLKRKGIGKELFNYVLEYFKSLNKSKMIIWCLRDNEPSRKFYIKMGGNITYEKQIDIDEKEYTEVGIVYDI